MTQAACQQAPGGAPARPVTPPAGAPEGVGDPGRVCPGLWVGSCPGPGAAADGPGGWLPIRMEGLAGSERSLRRTGLVCTWASRVIKTQLGLKRPLYLLTRTFVKKNTMFSRSIYTLKGVIPVVYLIS